jgi:hypothetical protein
VVLNLAIETAAQRRYVSAALVFGLVAYAGWSGWQGWIARVPLPAWPIANAALPEPAPMVSAAPLNMLFGLAPSTIPVASTTPLVLHASIVGATGQSRALLASGAAQQFYREGASLPDGSVLRAIDADRVLLWRNGREESLMRERSTVRYFTPASRADMPSRSAAANTLIRPGPPIQPDSELAP